MLDIFANMPIQRDTPEVAVLMNAVEKKFGHKPESRSDFTALSYDIEKTIREHLAENTLRRIWGRLKGYQTVFVRTPDVRNVSPRQSLMPLPEVNLFLCSSPYIPFRQLRYNIFTVHTTGQRITVHIYAFRKAQNDILSYKLLIYSNIVPNWHKKKTLCQQDRAQI